MRRVIAFVIFCAGLAFGNWAVAIIGFLLYEAFCRMWLASVISGDHDDHGPLN